MVPTRMTEARLSATPKTHEIPRPALARPVLQSWSMRRFAVLVSLALLFPPGVAVAEHFVTLDEVIPALAGTELGRLELGPAPAPGSSRTVRASEVRAALRGAGRDARGLSIPAVTRVHRAARRVGATELDSLVAPALDAAVQPCRLSDLVLPGEVTVAPGEIAVSASAAAPARSGRISARVVLSVGGRDTELHVQADATCPPPAVAPGDRVQIVVRTGNVRASAPGVATQPGRAGDVIRVTNRLTRGSLLARVRAPGLVEVEP